ncbi:MAG: hypothetical protein ACREDM_03695 [Methylocella sp.]
MLLRPRQKLFVECKVAALTRYAHAAGFGSTGAGKTIMQSATAGVIVGGTGAKFCVQPNISKQRCLQKRVQSARESIVSAPVETV